MTMNRTNDQIRDLARRMGRAARLAPYHLTRRAWAFDRLKARLPTTLIRYCEQRGISLAGVERAYRVAFDEAR